MPRIHRDETRAAEWLFVSTAGSTPGVSPSPARTPGRAGRSDEEVVTFDLRPLSREDAGAIGAFFDRLSDRSRYLRFASPTPRLSERQLAELTAADGDRRIGWVASVSGEIVAVAHLVRLGEGEAVADIAIAVADSYQRSGLGTRLFETLALEACRRGIRHLEYSVLGENRPAQRLLRRFDGVLRYSAGLGEGRLPVERIAGPCGWCAA